jgi:hypothetical protein
LAPVVAQPIDVSLAVGFAEEDVLAAVAAPGDVVGRSRDRSGEPRHALSLLRKGVRRFFPVDSRDIWDIIPKYRLGGPSYGKALSTAVVRLLSPLIRALLRNGMFLQGLLGTRLTRKEVQRLLGEQGESAIRSPSRKNRAGDRWRPSVMGKRPDQRVHGHQVT